MRHAVHSIPLQTILKLDAITCLVMAGLLMPASGAVAGLTGISASVLFWAGVLLLPVAAFMWALSRAVDVPIWGTAIVVAGNLLWVLASLTLPVLGAISPNALGWAIVLVQASAVAVFAWLEWTSARRLAVLP